MRKEIISILILSTLSRVHKKINKTNYPIINDLEEAEST